MNVYAVISLLLVSNVAGSEMVDHLEGPPAIAENADKIVLRRNSNHDPGDEVVLDPETQQALKNLVCFYLYTKDNPIDEQQLYLNDAVTLNRSNFNFSRPTKIVTHGWQNSMDDDAVSMLRKAYLKHGDYNIVTIDWRKISRNLKYIEVSESVRKVSRFCAYFINFLQTQGLDLSTVTFVGHSLGAHVAGLTAKSAKGMDLVVALDPALPNFAIAEDYERVALGDAKYVLVIHTNAGFLGFETAIGDVDFYPNGGNLQRGCELIKSTSTWLPTWLLNLLPTWPPNTCSHSRSYEFFAESINSDNFIASACETYDKLNKGKCKSNAKAVMGGVNPDRNVKGTYFLNTNEKRPFATGEAE